MNNPITKLTECNWEEISNKKYHIDFLNDRNAVRAILYDLLQIDNDIKCTNIEIQSLKTNFESQLGFLEDEIKRIEEDEYVVLEMKNQHISELINKIEEVNSAFSREIAKYQDEKEKRCQSISTNVEKLFEAKSKFKCQHQNQVESLRRFRLVCKRDLRSAVDKRVKSIDRKFCDELFYMASCEKDLKHLFSLLDDKSSISGTCASTTSTVEGSEICADFFTDFAWLRNEQFVKRTELFEYFKKHLAEDIVAALAAVHVYKPEEPIKFIANFLKHQKYNEFRMRRHEHILLAAVGERKKFDD